MISMLDTIVPKSDQLNADDFIASGQSKIIKITKVTLISGEQPCSIFYEGDNGKPYKPGLSMRRVLVHCWGASTNAYIGRSLELYRDPKVTFGGTEVGGIRISKMSHISSPTVIALTASRKLRKPFLVEPLVITEAKTEAAPSADEWISEIMQMPDMEALKVKYGLAQKAFKDSKDFARILEAKNKRKLELDAAVP